jgi:glucose-1-phosphate thymidylyltransferase
MKGIILAGGLGTRLWPLTKVTNKHLLPVYNKPMIFYPLGTLVAAGITDIMVVTGGNNAGDFLRLLGNGKDFGLRHLNYAYQEGEGGIAEALSLAEFFADEDPVCVILGDNIIEDSVHPYVEKFQKQGSGAKILLKAVPHPERFGVPELSGDRVVTIHEKPKTAPSQYAVTGIYLYDHRVFDIIRTLRRSERGELEITDVNNQYIEWSQMTYDILEGWWTDAGTLDSLLLANNLVAKKVKEQNPTALQAARNIVEKL